MLTRIFFDVSYCFVCFALLSQQESVLIEMSPAVLLVCSTGVSICAGLGSLWRTVDEITVRDVVSHSLNMGTCGASLSMLMYSALQNRFAAEWMIIGFVGLISLGGIVMLEFILELIKSTVKAMIPKFLMGRSHDDE